MKTENISSRAIILLVAATLIFGGCKKKKETITPDPVTDTDTEQTTATDNALSENIASDIESMGSEGSENSGLTTFRPSGETTTWGIEAVPCATVTTSSLTPKSFTVDFGTTGCTGLDGRTRTGKLIFDFSNSTSGAVHYRNPGFNMNVSAQNYVVDGYSVTINSKNITNTTPSGAPAGTNLTWSVTANISILKPGGGSITWTCNRTKELTNTSDAACYSGQSNPINWNKAIVKLNGSASGTNAKNETFTSVASNLIRNFNCAPSALQPHRHPFIGGTLTYTPANRYPRIINYGNGTDCDFNATITINNMSYNILLQ